MKPHHAAALAFVVLLLVPFLNGCGADSQSQQSCMAASRNSCGPSARFDFNPTEPAVRVQTFRLRRN